MFNFTLAGWVHTLTALIALASAAVMIVRSGEIRSDTRLGVIYIAATAISALTALVIHQRGGFGPGHLLAIVALAALALAPVLRRGAQTGSWRHVASAGTLSFTLLCHLIPGATETLLRVPVGAPFAASPQDPALRAIFLGLLVTFLIAATIQALLIRSRRRAW